MLFVAKERNKLSVTCAHQESKRFTNYIYSKTQSDNSDCIQCTFIILASNICGLLSKLILTFYYYNSTIKEIDITKSPELISQLRQRPRSYVEVAGLRVSGARQGFAAWTWENPANKLGSRSLPTALNNNSNNNSNGS